ncbi:hypothetical protein B0H14DRAFT_3457824 [Mycena olivaceomarginata]|nr:hypothetical protein B0H14DRAFT_3457824 [Mycena olivaceomarginata]
MVKKGRTNNRASEVHSHTATFSLAEITGNTTEIPITTYVFVEPPSPVKRQRVGVTQPVPDPPLPNVDLDNSERYQMGFDLDDQPPEIPSSTPVRAANPRFAKPSDPALHRFRGIRDAYLGNLLCRDGCIWPYASERCARCQAPTNTDNPQIFRCKSCYGDKLLCAPCIVAEHAKNPLHAIERWNGVHFVPSTLKELGLHVQLGHRPEERCPEPAALHSEFVVLHTNGIHIVAVDSCDCEHRVWAGAPEEQLLRAGWFPATDDKPRTCATIEVLDSFVTQTYQAKTTMYDFYTALKKLTNHTGVKPPYHYHAFLRMVREFSHLMMLKQAGHSHAKSGIMGTKQGELALRYPCCPIPDVNLPVGWEHVPPQSQFLYIVFLAFDACFRLKRRLVLTELKDPSLGSGWVFLLQSVPYRKFLLTVTDQKEMSTCSGLAALDFAKTKFARGYSATGVGMGVCVRHEFVQPNGVGDLQKGEWYANMDYIFVIILMHLDPRLHKIISYDIVCQWWKNLRDRLLNMLPGTRFVLIMQLFRFVIPKMHIKGHLADCQVEYSLDLVPGSAETDGEAIERPWAHIGGIGTSIREMGPGSREDTLNTHWGSWNWDKLIGLGERLRTKLDRANKEYADQLKSFTEFSTQQADRVPQWKKKVEDFEADPTQPNPYWMKRTALTEAVVLLQFEQEEAERVWNGVPSIHSVSPGSFIAAALEVEDEQRHVCVQVEHKKGGTTAQEIDVLGLRRGLNRSILRLHNLQATYTPVAIVALGQRQNVPEAEQPENVPLFLPSVLTPVQRQLDGVKELAAIKDSVRDAQCSSALERLRRQLHVKSRLLTYKKWQSRHQGANTRSRGIVERNEMKIRLHSEKYQMAWAAKVRLAGGDVRGVGWPMLRKEDIWCMEDAEELARSSQKWTEQAQRRADREADLCRMGELPPLTSVEEEERAARGGESVRLVSWIWTAAGTSGSDEDLEEALCMEWCKAYARVRRWAEEVQLVKEEVRCIGVTLEYRAVEWEN